MNYQQENTGFRKNNFKYVTRSDLSGNPLGCEKCSDMDQTIIGAIATAYFIRTQRLNFMNYDVLFTNNTEVGVHFILPIFKQTG